MSFRGVSCKQREALILKARGFSDQEIAAAVGIKHREAACRLRTRGRRAIARILVSTSSEMTIDEVIASYVRAEVARHAQARAALAEKRSA